MKLADFFKNFHSSSAILVFSEVCKDTLALLSMGGKK